MEDGGWMMSDGELEVGWMDACIGHEGRVSGMWVVGLENRSVGGGIECEMG